MQNNMISIRNTSLYGSQLSSVVFAGKTATLGQELQVTMGPSPYGSQPLFVAFAFKTATLAPELQVSIGPRPHLSFCARKTA